MTTRYVGIGGNDANDGLSWANRKLTLNGVEDTPVAAGDVVYVGPGIYREMLTVDVSGSVGDGPITYIGDYDGSHTDGVGGEVRITGSDNDTSSARDYCISINNKNYRTFKNFKFDLTSIYLVTAVTAASNIIYDGCYFGENGSTMVFFRDESVNCAVRNCYFLINNATTNSGVRFFHDTGLSDCGNVVENCIFISIAYGISAARVGGVVVRNCTIIGSRFGVYITSAPPAGQYLDVYNSLILGCSNYSLYGTTGNTLRYGNCVLYSNNFAPYLASDQGNNNTRPVLFDSRWFFEMVNG